MVADRRYPIAETVQVSASSGLIAVEYRSINFKTRPGAMVYRYRLKGRDEAWATTSRRRVEYQDLQPGHYTFQVTAVDRDFNYSMPAAVELEVVPDARDEMIDELERRVSVRTAELERKNRQLEEAMAQLRQTQQQLVLQEKMAALGNLVAGIVHELNSPLGAATSAVDVAQRSLDRIAGRPQSDTKESLERFLAVLAQNNQITGQAIKRIDRIVESLKSFYPPRPGRVPIGRCPRGARQHLDLVGSGI